MVEIVRRKVPIMGAHRKRGNLVWKFAIGVLINEGELVTVMQEIRQIVGMNGLNFAPLIDDTFILQFNVRRWLEIRSAEFLQLRVVKLWTIKEFAQKRMKLKSSIRCRHPQS